MNLGTILTLSDRVICFGKVCIFAPIHNLMPMPLDGAVRACLFLKWNVTFEVFHSTPSKDGISHWTVWHRFTVVCQIQPLWEKGVLLKSPNIWKLVKFDVCGPQAWNDAPVSWNWRRKHTVVCIYSCMPVSVRSNDSLGNSKFGMCKQPVSFAVIWQCLRFLV